MVGSKAKWQSTSRRHVMLSSQAPSGSWLPIRKLKMGCRLPEFLLIDPHVLRDGRSSATTD